MNEAYEDLRELPHCGGNTSDSQTFHTEQQEKSGLGQNLVGIRTKQGLSQTRTNISHTLQSDMW